MVERSRNPRFAILGGAVLLFIILLLCALKIICPAGECGPGLIACDNCPYGCCLPNGNCPCPPGSAPCQDSCPGITCPSGCCTENCQCTVTPDCPANTLWSSTDNCCILTAGENIGKCASVCSVDPTRIGGCVAGIDSCDLNSCCPPNSVGWFEDELDPAKSCCKDEAGNCMFVCNVDMTRIGCDAPGTDACLARSPICTEDDQCTTCVNKLCGGIVGSRVCEADDDCAEIECGDNGVCEGIGSNSCCPYGAVSWGPDPNDPSIMCCQNAAGECMVLCSTDPQRTICPEPGVDACNLVNDAEACCPRDTSWNSDKQCCSNTEGQCYIDCGEIDCTTCKEGIDGISRCGGIGNECNVDAECTGAICHRFLGCIIPKCSNDAECRTCKPTSNLEIKQCGGVGFNCNADSDCTYMKCFGGGCCREGTTWNREKQCCVYLESPAVCAVNCAAGTVYSVSSSCCVYQGTAICAGECPEGTTYNAEQMCCTYSESEICYGSCPEGTTYNSEQRCCVYEDSDICYNSCPAGSNYNGNSKCCVYDGTNICVNENCPLGSEYSDTLACCLNPEGSECLTPCQEGFTSCGSTCCSINQVCSENVCITNPACPTVQKCGTSCCLEDQICLNEITGECSALCPFDRICGSACCPEEQLCVDARTGTCSEECPIDQICGDNCCSVGESCIDQISGTCTETISSCPEAQTCGTKCCGEGEFCVNPSSEVCSGEVVTCQATQICGTRCCDEGQTCLDQFTETCSGDTVSGCPATQACGDACCDEGQTCTDANYGVCSTTTTGKDCSYPQPYGACIENIICSSSCSDIIGGVGRDCTDLRIGSKTSGEVCSSSTECECGLNCQIIEGVPGAPGVCCSGGLFTCFSGVTIN